MTIRESFKARYANGQLHGVLFKIVEGAAIAAASGIIVMYGTVSKMEGRFEERFNGLKSVVNRVEGEIKTAVECVQKHASDLAIHYPHEIKPVPAPGGKGH